MFAFVSVLFAAATTMSGSPSAADDIGVCSAVQAQLDPNGDTLMEDWDLVAAMAAAKLCAANGDPRGAVSVAYMHRANGDRTAAKAILSAAPATSAEAARLQCRIAVDEKLDSALADCDRAIALRPGWSGAYNTRASALREAGRLQEALAASERAIALSPGNASFLINQAVTLEKLNRLGEALIAYATAAGAAPRGAEPWENIGRIQLAQGDSANAIASLDRAIAIKPSAVTFDSRGNAKANLKQFEAALADYASASGLDPCAARDR